MKVILYARVSTSDQSCEAQFLELRAHCAIRKWTVVKEFSDTISGTKSARPGLDALMVMVRAKEVDAVCAVKIDRMARSIVHFSRMAAELVKCGIALICPGQGIDTSNSNPCGKFQMNVLAAVAELERDFIVERTKAGLAVARAHGKILGRVSKKMPSQVDRVRIVREWIEAGAPGYEDLAKRLGGVSRSTAWRIAEKLVIVTPPPEIEEVEV